jgi:glycosyltransferase involved in cell wall biosynthesis
MGALAIVDEIAPTHLEDRIIAEEQERFPGWEPAHAPTPPAFLDRLEAEWAVADRIVVNSQWSRQALLDEGADPEKIAVVPISYQTDRVLLRPKTRSKDGPLKVLWLGTLNLRKGFPYAIEAARRLLGHPVEFTFVGPSTIDLGTVDWPDNATYLGQIPRPDIPDLWDRHHLYLLPTLSDGFAITQIEAQAHGLPIIVTPNCADVVVDGWSGLRVPPRDSGAIVDAILSYLDGGNDLTAASVAAIQRAKAFSPEAVWPQLRAVLSPDQGFTQAGALR